MADGDNVITPDQQMALIQRDMSEHPLANIAAVSPAAAPSVVNPAAPITAPVAQAAPAQPNIAASLSRPTTPAQGIPLQRPDYKGAAIPGTQVNIAQPGQTPQYQTAPYNFEEKVNPLLGVYAHAENVHNPALRVLSRVASGLGAAAEGFAGGTTEGAPAREARVKELQAADKEQTEAQEMAQRKLQMEESQQKLGAEDLITDAMGNVAGYKMGGKLYPLEGAPQNIQDIAKNFAGGGGKNPDEMTYRAEYTKAIQAGQSPQDAAISAYTAVKTLAQGTKPPTAEMDRAEFSRLAPAVTGGSATPQQQARYNDLVAMYPTLAPVGTSAASYNQRAAQIWAAKSKLDAQNYNVLPTDSQEVAEKKLADLRSDAGVGQRQEAINISQTDKSAEEGSEVVRAVDKDGKVHLISRADYDSNKGEYQGNPIKMTPAALDKATDHATAINEVQGRANDLARSIQRMNFNDKGQMSIVKQALMEVNKSYPDEIIGYPITKYLADNLKQLGLEGATPETRNYITNLLSMREAALAIPKEVTGGSRQSDISANALWSTLPSGTTPSADWAMNQMKATQSILDRLRSTRVPIVPGMLDVQKDPTLYQLAPYTGKNGTIYSDDGKTWYDANGNKVGK